MTPAVTSWWAASALGCGFREMAASLAACEAPGMRRISGDIPGRDIFFGCIDAALPEIASMRWNMRSCRLLALAADAMRPSLDALFSRHSPGRIGIVLGASNTGIDEAENFVDRWLESGEKPAALDFSMIELGTPSLYLKERLGVAGPAYTVSTACSSATKAFGSARRLLERGVCDAVIVGGVDGRCRFAMNGFAALGALSADRCRPLAPDRDGINLGEAVALFILERPDATDGRHPSLAGTGESSDAYHATAPDPDGAGAEAAMRAALRDAQMPPSGISYINLHGTGTIANDDMEMNAVHRIFPGIADGMGPKVESTKSLTGHCLGAAGAIEAAICLLRLDEFGPGCAAMSNSFAFGGSNACVIFKS